MKSSNVMPVNMESEALENLKRDMDLLITRTLMAMQKWDNNEAAITVKLTINLEDAAAEDGKGGMRAVIVPRFEHKVSAVLQAKSEIKGRANESCELVFDPDTNTYAMKSLDKNQTSLFDGPLPFSDEEDLTIDDDDLLLIDDQDDEELEIDYEQAQAQ